VHLYISTTRLCIGQIYLPRCYNTSSTHHVFSWYSYRQTSQKCNCVCKTNLF